MGNRLGPGLPGPVLFLCLWSCRIFSPPNPPSKHIGKLLSQWFQCWFWGCEPCMGLFVSLKRLSCSTVPDFHAGMMKLMECWIVLGDLQCLVFRRFWRACLSGVLFPADETVPKISSISGAANETHRERNPRDQTWAQPESWQTAGFGSGVAYCHVVILDMEGEGNLSSSGSTAYISPGSVLFLLRIPAGSWGQGIWHVETLSTKICHHPFILHVPWWLNRSYQEVSSPFLSQKPRYLKAKKKPRWLQATWRSASSGHVTLRVQLVSQSHFHPHPPGALQSCHGHSPRSRVSSFESPPKGSKRSKRLVKKVPHVFQKGINLSKFSLRLASWSQHKSKVSREA